jgi:hypothetical protein
MPLPLVAAALAGLGVLQEEQTVEIPCFRHLRLLAVALVVTLALAKLWA